MSANHAVPLEVKEDVLSVLVQPNHNVSNVKMVSSLIPQHPIVNHVQLIVEYVQAQQIVKNVK